MRQSLSVILAFAILAHSASASPDTANVATQIVAMPLGAHIELRLKNKQKLRGSRGVVSNAGFSLVDAQAAEREIAFDDVLSVKQLDKPSHTGRNVLIAVGIATAAAAILVIAYAVALGKLGHSTSIERAPWSMRVQSC
jgi:cell division protein FtsX